VVRCINNTVSTDMLSLVLVSIILHRNI